MKQFCNLTYTMFISIVLMPYEDKVGFSYFLVKNVFFFANQTTSRFQAVKGISKGKI